MDGKRAVLSLLFSVLVACGGAAPATGGASAGASEGAAAATNAAPSPSSAASAAGGSAVSGPKLTDLLSASKTAQYKITYKITTAGAGAEGFSGEQTWYFKPPQSRFDFSVSQGGQKLTCSFFNRSDGNFYCFNAGQVQCLRVQGTSSPLDQNAAALAQRSLIDNPGSYGATFTSTKTIAGQAGQCYDVKANATSGGFTSGSFCYTKDGVPLLSSFSVAGQSWSMEATNYSATVPDADFELPAKAAN